VVAENDRYLVKSVLASKNEISKFMSDKIASLDFSLDETTERFKGNASPKDLEYLMQMLQAYFTDLNYNEEAFNGYKAKTQAMLGSVMASPIIFFTTLHSFHQVRKLAPCAGRVAQTA
jgi:zinc protease